jgi:phage tail protein X
MMWFNDCKLPTGVNVALTEVADVSVSPHPAVPVHAPDHAEKMLFAPAIGVSVTCVFCGKVAEQVPGQLIPAGLLVTVPVPETLTVNGYVGLNFAVTALAALTVKLQVPVPEHAPPHPPNIELTPGEAVSVTCVPWSKLAEHVVGQLMPAGLLVTVPGPETVTVSLCVGLKVAVTALAAVTDTLQARVPEQAPLHPPNVEFGPGEAVSVTSVPRANIPKHDVGQLIPAGLLVTVPGPVAVTVSG